MMSLESLERGIAFVESAGSADFAGPQPESIVRAAERALGVEFPESYRRFLLRLGFGDFCGEAFLGVSERLLGHAGHPNVVWVTLHFRKVAQLPPAMILVHELGDGELHAIDVAHEGQIVAWVPGMSQPDEPLEVLSPDFGEFFAQLVEEAYHSF